MRNQFITLYSREKKRDGTQQSKLGCYFALRELCSRLQGRCFYDCSFDRTVGAQKSLPLGSFGMFH